MDLGGFRNVVQLLIAHSFLTVSVAAMKARALVTRVVKSAQTERNHGDLRQTDKLPVNLSLG